MEYTGVNLLGLRVGQRFCDTMGELFGKEVAICRVRAQREMLNVEARIKRDSVPTWVSI